MNLIFQTWAHIKKDLLIYETPLGQINENEMKNFIKKYDGDLGTIGLILVLLFTEQWEDNFEMTLTVVAIVFLSILLILSIKKKQV